MFGPVIPIGVHSADESVISPRTCFVNLSIPLNRQGISRFTQIVSLFLIFRYFVPQNRKSKFLCPPLSCLASKVAASKSRALALYFPIRIWHAFWILTCKGKSDLDLCMSSVLEERMHCAVPTSDLKTCLDAEFVGSRHYAAAFSSQAPKSCTYLHLILLYISTLKTRTEFVRENKMLALGDASCNPARVMAAGLPRQDDVWITAQQLVCFHKIELDEMRCKLDSFEYACSSEQNPILPFLERTILSGISARASYKAFHWICCCGDATICRY